MTTPTHCIHGAYADLCITCTGAAFHTAMTITTDLFAQGAPAAAVQAAADGAYLLALEWSTAAGQALAAHGWAAGRKVSALADSAIWAAIAVGGKAR